MLTTAQQTVVTVHLPGSWRDVTKAGCFTSVHVAKHPEAIKITPNVPTSPSSRNDCTAQEGDILRKALPAPWAVGNPV